MRLLSFIFIIVLAASISAQTPTTREFFDEATWAARTGQFEKALKNYERALSLAAAEKTNDEFLSKIHYNIGVCLFRLRRSAEAVKKFGEAIRLSGGGYQKAFRALGMAETELKNWAPAEASFRAALKLKKSDGETWFDLAFVLIEKKDFDAAREAFQNAIKYETTAAADAHNNVGVILALKGDLAAAEKKFKIALRKSGGKSVEAGRNLEFCKIYKQKSGRAGLTNLKFSRAAVGKSGA
jgi:Flp pilus assembly protein TadD